MSTDIKPADEFLVTADKPQTKSTNPLWGNVSKLLDVKSIITLALVGLLCVLAFRQDTKIPPEMLSAVISSIVTYFFTKKVDEKSKG